MSLGKWAIDLWQCKKQHDKSWQFGQWLCEHWHIAAAKARYAKGICLICHSQESRSQVVEKSAESREPVFTSMDMLPYSTDSRYS
jgi:hypothetical protein